MAKTFVQLPADGAGKRVGTFDVTAWDGTNLAHLHGMVICDSAGNIVDTLTAAPAGTERGIVTRPIPSGTQAVSGPLTDTQLRASAVATSATQLPVALAAGGGIKVEGVAGGVAQPVSGTFFQATQPVSVPALTKGTQNAQGLSVQNLKDSGRVAVAITCYQAAGIITTEALFAAAAFSRSLDGATATTGNSFTVTAGKRFRIESITVGTKQTAAALTASKVALRYLGAGGVITNTSPVVAMLDIGSNVATANNYVAPTTIPIGDGFELVGGGTFGFTNLSSSATVLHTITLLGFEY